MRISAAHVSKVSLRIEPTGTSKMCTCARDAKAGKSMDLARRCGFASPCTRYYFGLSGDRHTRDSVVRRITRKDLIPETGETVVVLKHQEEHVTNSVFVIWLNSSETISICQAIKLAVAGSS